MDQRQLKGLITSGQLSFGGNSKLKIYGMLSCSSGKRMKKDNRVFFQNEKEALDFGFRPCGNCMKEKFLGWKQRKNRVE